MFSFGGGPLKQELLERRSEMLKLRGKGLSLNETVKTLTSRYGVTETALYIDWNKRDVWAPAILSLDDPEKMFLDIAANHREIYQMTVLEYLQADNSSARIGALRLLRDLNRDFYEMNVTPEIMSKLKKLEELTKQGVFVK